MNKQLISLFHVATFSLILFSLTSCGTLEVAVDPKTSFSRENPITIVNSQKRNVASLGYLQYLLKENGYKLISYDVAEKTINIDTSTNYDKSHQTVSNGINYKSAYVLKYDFVPYKSDDDIFEQFSATLTDLTSGEIIMSAHITGTMDIHDSLEQLVYHINSFVK